MPLDKEIVTSHYKKPGPDSETRLSLLIYYRDGVEVVPLHPGQPLVVGRGDPSDVVINEQTLSRQHARFGLVDDQVWVEDLSTTNGTSVNGKLVTRCTVTQGDQIGLGAVSVCVHQLSPTERKQRILTNHDRFLADLEDEIARARTYGRSVGLVAVRSDRRSPGQLGRWCPRVQELLRPFDRIGLYSADEVEIAMPEASHEELAALAHQVVQGAQPHEPVLLCGVGLFPDSAASADELIEVTRRAGLQATPESPIVSATSSHTTFEPSADLPASSRAEGPIVQSPQMASLYETVDRLANARIPVLIYGETGTGKEVIARELHARGPLRDRPMKCINCGAIPSQLIESALFGHERGAFTGAHQRSKGLFEEAEGGTVLLDEIGELSPAAQTALLRVLETKRISRVGSSRELVVDVRILAATNRDLEQMCEAQTFRWDLLYRLNTMMLRIPPLRERQDEIAPLVFHFIQQANQDNRCRVHGVSPDALNLLCRYPWPGNVRELRNVIERAVVIVEHGVIDVRALSERVRDAGAEGRSRPATTRPTAEARRLDRPSGKRAGSITEVFEVPEEVWQSSGPVGAGAADKAPAPTSPAPPGSMDLKAEMERHEQALLLCALGRTGWNQAEAARLLHMPVRTLFYKIKHYGLRQEAGQASSSDPQLDEVGALAFKQLMQKHESRLIVTALECCGGDRAQAADWLQISARTLANKMRSYDL